jgi:hypothetical protein
MAQHHHAFPSCDKVTLLPFGAKKPIKLPWRHVKRSLSAWLRSGSFIILMHLLVTNTSDEPRSNALSVSPRFRCRCASWKKRSVSS